MQMGTGLDTGDMISRIVVPLAKDETGGSLFDKLAQAGAELLVQTYRPFLTELQSARNSRRRVQHHMLP